MQQWVNTASCFDAQPWLSHVKQAHMRRLMTNVINIWNVLDEAAVAVVGPVTLVLKEIKNKLSDFINHEINSPQNEYIMKNYEKLKDS